MNDVFRMQFSDAEQTAQGLLQEAQALYDMLGRTQGSMNRLYSSGLQGSFLDEIQARAHNIESMLRHLGDEANEAGTDLQTVVALARQLDGECALGFNLPPGLSLGGAHNPNNPYIMPYPIGMSPKGVLVPLGVSGVDMKDFAYHPVHGSHLQGYAGYREGYMIDEEYKAFRDGDPLAAKWSDYVSTKATLWDEHQSASWAVAEGTMTGNLGTLHTSAFSAELEAGASYSFDKDGMKVKADFEAGFYAVKAEANAEIAGVDIAAEGYIGANAEGSAAMTFNPLTGEAGVNAELDFFAGGRVEAEISKDLGAVDIGAQGSLSYGIGATFEADIGITENVFRADVDIGATLGLGGEIGFTVELDLQEAGNDIVEFGNWLGGLI
jgi:hypothetical protein